MSINPRLAEKWETQATSWLIAKGYTEKQSIEYLETVKKHARFFRERGITDKVIAATVMFCGVLIIYLPLEFTQALAFVAATLIGMSLAFYKTRSAA